MFNQLTGVFAMWEWFTANSIWIFIVSSLVLILLLFGKDKVQEKIAKIVPDRLRHRMPVSATAIFRTIDGIAVILIATALVAITLSNEGIYRIVTPETIQRWLLEHGTRVLVILLVGFVLWYALQKLLPPLVRGAMARPVRGESRQGVKKRADTLLAVFMGLGRITVMLLVVFMVLSEFKVAIGPILAGLGIAGIAVGFGAQYLIRDLIAGIFILMENQYRVGDVAKVADIWGLVEEIHLRKTVLRDLDGAVHHVPNGEIKVASNYSRHFSRVNLNVSVAYDTDLDYAIGVTNRVCQELAEDENWRERIVNAPKVLRVDNLGDSGIDIKILGDVKPLEQWAVMGELRLRIKKAFDAEGIEIPWPHTKVYFGNSPGEERK